jgi:hypothetical protein
LVVTEGIAETVEIHLLFEYILQRVPTRTNRKILTKNDEFHVHLRLDRKNLDVRGYPDPRALWFAERQFLTEIDKKHQPDVRLLRWRVHLVNDPFVLSSYEVFIPRAAD